MSNIVCLKAKETGTFLTRTKAFKKLTKWAFTVCDRSGNGRVGKAELHAGILLVHINLAKYAGAAACYPPSRDIVEELFEASDDDKSGFIDEAEFTQIMVICCAQIASRILVYYAIIILLVPYVATKTVVYLLQLEAWLGWNMSDLGNPLLQWVESVFSWGEVAEQTISLILFFLLVPLFFNFIDRSSRTAAVKTIAKVA